MPWQKGMHRKLNERLAEKAMEVDRALVEALIRRPFDGETRRGLQACPPALLAVSGYEFGITGTVEHLEAVLGPSWLAMDTDARRGFVLDVLEAARENEEHGPRLVRALAERGLLTPADGHDDKVIWVMTMGCYNGLGAFTEQLWQAVRFDRDALWSCIHGLRELRAEAEADVRLAEEPGDPPLWDPHADLDYAFGWHWLEQLHAEASA
jgi:hypothetical protein